MCGIAGGIPHPAKLDDHVRLGDIVVSGIKGVVQYDFIKRTVKKKRTDVPEEVRAAPDRPERGVAGGGAGPGLRRALRQAALEALAG